MSRTMSLASFWVLAGLFLLAPLAEGAAPAPLLQRWEDKIFFEQKVDRRVALSLMAGELKTLEVQFNAPGSFRVVNTAGAPVALFFNEHPKNDQSSTKYSSVLERRISDDMTRLPWYLHVLSESRENAQVVLDLELVQTLATVAFPAADARREEAALAPAPAPPQARPSPSPVVASPPPAPTTPRPAGPSPVATKKEDVPDPCAKERESLAEARAALGKGDLQKADSLLSKLSGACPEVAPLKADVQKAARDLAENASKLVGQKRCADARAVVERLKPFSDIYSQASRRLESCEDPCPLLGSLAVSEGAARKGQGVEGRGQLAAGSKQCYRVTIMTRGDLEVLVDEGYSVEGRGLEVKGLKAIQVNNVEVWKVRYSMLNVAPSTTLTVTLLNNSGNRDYVAQFYLYPN